MREKQPQIQVQGILVEKTEIFLKNMTVEQFPSKKLKMNK